MVVGFHRTPHWLISAQGLVALIGRLRQFHLGCKDIMGQEYLFEFTWDDVANRQELSPSDGRNIQSVVVFLRKFSSSSGCQSTWLRG